MNLIVVHFSPQLNNEPFMCCEYGPVIVSFTALNENLQPKVITVIPAGYAMW